MEPLRLVTVAHTFGELAGQMITSQFHQLRQLLREGRRVGCAGLPQGTAW